MLLNFFGLSYSQNSLFWRRLGCTFLIFVSILFFLFSISTSDELCSLNWFPVEVSIKRLSSCKYNLSRKLNVCYIKSKNIWLHLIASSFWTSMLYFSRLRAILYCSNNSSIPAIIIHGLPISNGFIFQMKVIYIFHTQILQTSMDP